MESNFGERFKSARLLSGFSLNGVAEKLSKSVTRQAIYRYEKGEIIPDSKTLLELAGIFKVSVDFFFSSVGVEIGEIEYRRLKMPAKEETRVKEQTKNYLSRYLALEEILGIESGFVNPLKDFPVVCGYADVNQAANLLREKWRLGNGAIPNVAGLLEDKHIKVIKLVADGSFDGLQTFANAVIPVIAFNQKLESQKVRLRFTLLHELGHLLLNFDISLGNKEIEKLCHQFAGALLLPDETIYEELGRKRKRLSIQELGNVKKQYGISLQAIVMRASVCGIITDSFKRNFFNEFEQNNWQNNEPIFFEGNEESGRFEQLIYRALSEELISVSKAASFRNMSLISFKEELKQFNVP
jgi:Zn-dependent peptidase ImmA (M78 family)/DNA-binding XRE family transcriptional regulator